MVFKNDHFYYIGIVASETTKKQKQKQKRKRKKEKKKKKEENQNKRPAAADGTQSVKCKPILGHLNNCLYNDLINV